MQERRKPLAGASILALVWFTAGTLAQESPVVLSESFDVVTPPALPAGWLSSQRKASGGNDWVSTSSTAFSAPGAVLVTNATIEQWLTTPLMDWSGRIPDAVRMMVRRSGTFTAPIALDISADSGRTFLLPLGTIAGDAGNGSYQLAEFPLPPTIAGRTGVVLRWRVMPESTGTSGTFRLDDIRCSAAPFAGGTADSVFVNEIMFMPRTGEPEWIELYNAGATTADLRGWSVSDATTTARRVISAAAMPLASGEYCVLTGDTLALRNMHRGIASRCIQVSGFPSLNNSGDVVHLYTPAGACAESIAYLPLWGGTTGTSLERVDWQASSMEGSNWCSSVDSAGSTPGRVNSIVRRDVDLSVVRIGFPGRCSIEACDVIVTLRNAGRSPALAWGLVLCDDVDRDSVADEEEIVAQMTCSTAIAPGESLATLLAWPAPVPGKHSLRLEAVMEADERQSNNGMQAEVIIPSLPGSVRINEILYEPLTGMPEFVELINTSGSPVDCDHFSLSDKPTASGSVNWWVLEGDWRSGKSGKLWKPGEPGKTEQAGASGKSGKIGGSALRLPPGRFLTVVSDSSAPVWFPTLRGPDSGLVVTMQTSGLGLNNEGDMLVLKDAAGSVLDSVEYTAAFHTPDIPDTKGRSLELISPVLEGNRRSSWASCVDPSGGTPGARNSVAVAVRTSGALLQAAPNPFSPDGDGADDVSVLRYELPVRSALLRARIFDVRGRLVRELANIIPAGAAGYLVWDGRDDQGRRGRIGAYIAILEAIDGAGGIVCAVKCVVILAGAL